MAKRTARRIPAKIKFETRIGLLKHLPGMHYIEVPSKIVDALGGTFNVRLICTVNDDVTFQCGLVALGQGKGYISITKARLKRLGLEKGDKTRVVVEPDESEYGMPVADELVEVFAQDKEGHRRFQKLTPGRQRYVINYVNAVKSSEKRHERAVMLIENLKLLPEGKEEFRKMLGKTDE